MSLGCVFGQAIRSSSTVPEIRALAASALSPPRSYLQGAGHQSVGVHGSRENSVSSAFPLNVSGISVHLFGERAAVERAMCSSKVRARVAFRPAKAGGRCVRLVELNAAARVHESQPRP